MSNTQEIQTVVLNTLYKSAGSLQSPSWILNDGINDIQGLKLKSAMIPLAIYNIDARNNIISFIEQATSGTTRTATLTPQNYTGTSIATEVATRMTAAGTQTYTVVYSSTTNTLNISAAANFKMMPVSNSAYYEMGYENLLNSFGISQTGANQIDLSGVKCINIVSNVGASQVIGSAYKMLASIYTPQLTTNISTYMDESSDYIASQSVSNLTEIYISLYDDRFRAITPSKDYSLTINFLV